MPKKRRGESRTPRPKMYIFCEGAKTEPGYINGYLDFVRDGSLREVVRIQPTKKNTPAQLVDEAVSLKKSSSVVSGDVFWVVYDREAVAKYSEDLHAKAFKRAADNSINVALSNVCFELWLIWHLVDSSAPYSCYDDLIARSQLRGKFRELFNIDYTKANVNIFSLLSSRVQEARERAERINRNVLASALDGQNKPYQLNPYTDMPRLLDAIDDFG